MASSQYGRIAALAAAASFLVTACGGGASSTAPTAAAPLDLPAGSQASGGVPGPLEDAATVRFGIFPNITHAPGLVALADGGQLSTLLPNAAIEVKSFSTGTTAVEALFSDAIDITFIGPNPAINAYSKARSDVQLISGSTSGGAFLVVRPEITTPADLAGRKIASPSLGNTQDVALRAWLADQGFATDTAGGGDVSVVPQENSQTLETIIAGTIDGAWVPEPWATRLIQDAGATVLVDERDLWPDGQYVTTHLFASKRFVEANPEVVRRILLATIQAVDFVNDSPAEAQAIVNAEIEKLTTKKLGDELLETAWGNLTFTVDPIASSLQASADDAMALDLLDDPGDLAGLYNLAPLNELLKALGRPEVSGL